VKKTTIAVGDELSSLTTAYR